MKVPPYVKTSLAPGSRVVTEYLEHVGLQKYLNDIGFNLVGYGCTTCIGNSGPLDPSIEAQIVENDIMAASVLSGNRNFEARVHQNIKANFLMSPPLVVAFALAGTVVKDVYTNPLGQDRNGERCFPQGHLWPKLDEVKEISGCGVRSRILPTAVFRIRRTKSFVERYSDECRQGLRVGRRFHIYPGTILLRWIFRWRPGVFSDIRGARALAIFGDSVTTDHISPAGAIKANSPAGLYLQGLGVEPRDFNSYGSRRGNDRVMLRGTFANVRIKNLMVAPVEGGFTKYYGKGASNRV